MSKDQMLPPDGIEVIETLLCDYSLDQLLCTIVHVEQERLRKLAEGDQDLSDIEDQKRQEEALNRIEDLFHNAVLIGDGAPPNIVTESDYFGNGNVWHKISFDPNEDGNDIVVLVDGGFGDDGRRACLANTISSLACVS